MEGADESTELWRPYCLYVSVCLCESYVGGSAELSKKSHRLPAEKLFFGEIYKSIENAKLLMLEPMS